jgi:hypothetical protein
MLTCDLSNIEHHHELTLALQAWTRSANLGTDKHGTGLLTCDLSNMEHHQ